MKAHDGAMLRGETRLRPEQGRTTRSGMALREDCARTRLVHVTTNPAFLGFLRGQGAFLRSLGFEVHAISSPGPELSWFGKTEQVPVHAVQMFRDLTPIRDIAAVWRLSRLLRRLRPRIIDAHTPKAGLLGMISGALARIPVRIYHLHGIRFITTSGWKRRILRLAERLACALAHRVLAVSPSVMRIAIEEGLCPPDKIGVVLGGTINGVDARGRFRPQPGGVRAAARLEADIPPEALVIGFVGRLSRDKGIVELAAAWRRLRADPRLHLLVVGEVDQWDAPPGEVLTELRSDPRAHAVGPVADPTRWYAAMDVVALPTYREGFPQVALEAAAMSLPLVATAVSGCIDAVQDGVTGTLVQARDIEGFVSAISRYVANAGLRAAHGAAARRRVLEEFAPDVITGALATEYRALLDA